MSIAQPDSPLELLQLIQNSHFNDTLGHHQLNKLEAKNCNKVFKCSLIEEKM